jgi:hypothetical protein
MYNLDNMCVFKKQQHELICVLVLSLDYYL